jgi:hypothetical protein
VKTVFLMVGRGSRKTALGAAARDRASYRRRGDAPEDAVAAAVPRDSARRREVDAKDWTPKVLAFVIVGGMTPCDPELFRA